MRVRDYISYGLYVVGSKKDAEENFFVADSFFQIANKPDLFALSCHKDNYSHGIITYSKKFSVSILKNTDDFEDIYKYGLQSGKYKNKLEGQKYIVDDNLPVYNANTIGYMLFEVVDIYDASSHTLFIAKKYKSKLFEDAQPLTYLGYKSQKGAVPDHSPSK